MATRIKRHLISKIAPMVKEKYRSHFKSTNMKILSTNLSQYTIHLQSQDNEFLEETDFSKVNLEKDCIEEIKLLHSPRIRGFAFKLNRDYFVESILNYISSSKLEPHMKENPRNIVLDYSSPNIAKPFHMGHLRSTIIGNFIANVNEYFGENVTRINYLGDWGTQFGLLNVGVENLNYTDEQIKENPINLLYKAYVHANKLAENDENISIKAKEYFTQLETGESKDLKNWELYRKYTLDELRSTYERLGVKFDEYHWESSYGSNVAKGIVDMLVNKKIAKVHDDGHTTININDREVTLKKSDGSSLYLTRDIAAVLDRFERYAFDEMLYVVSNAQADHFAGLFNVLEQMEVPFAGRCKHVKFGEVLGLSTRKGNAVFLKDILDQAKAKMYQQQNESKTTKVDFDDEKTTDILGITAVIINDLNQKRMKGYEMNWDKIIKTTGISGIKLQYLHCRLWNLEQNAGVEIPAVCDPEYLREHEADELIHVLGKFDYYLENCQVTMDSYIFLNYLFKLALTTNTALQALRVKHAEPKVAEQRLFLFHCARIALNRGMKVLGTIPLNQM